MSPARFAGGIALALLAGPWAAPAQEQATVAEPTIEAREGPKLAPARGWPIWVKDFATRERAEQTSDLVFAGREADGTRDFFLVDEIGMLRFCRVSPRASLRLERVAIGRSLIETLSETELWDFEGLALVPHVDLRDAGRPLPDSLSGWLSIEGRGPLYRVQTTVLDVALIRQGEAGADSAAPPLWRVEARGETFPGGHFWQGQVGPNRGLAGLSVAANLAFLGLSRGEAGREVSNAGTFLYLYDRARARVAYVSTRAIGIYSVSGIDAWSDTLSVVLDRDRQSIFVLRWSAEQPGQLTDAWRFPLDLPAPGGFHYAQPQLEGVAVDEAGDFWCVGHPPAGQGRPIGAAPESTCVYLAAEIPMLYCFRGEPVWKAVGVKP